MKALKVIVFAWLCVMTGVVAEGETVVTAPESPYEFEPLCMWDFPAKDFLITKYGAKKGDVAANTAAFAKAMTACNKAGGGRVVVPEGEWLTGPIHFKSNCNLFLSEGAKVVFEDDLKLYYPAVQTSWEGTECMNVSPLVYAFECENIAITGTGMLAPKMDFWRTWFQRPESHIQATRQLYGMCSTGVPVEFRRMDAEGVQMRPHLIHFNRCKNIQFAGFKIRESPFWTIHTFMCKDVWVHNLDVYAHGHNNDGIDLEMTQHAVVENCRFDQGDDAVVLKAGRNQDGWRLGMPTQDIVVRNCEIVKGHCLLGIGSEMSGGVRRVYMHDCSSSDQVYRLFYIKTNHRRGGFVEDITVENVSATKMLRVFEIDTDVLYQWRDIVPTFETKITKIRNIAIRHAEAQQADAVYELRGDSREPIDGVKIEDIHVKQLMKFVNNAEFVRNLETKNIVYDSYTPSDDDKSNVAIPGIAPGR